MITIQVRTKFEGVHCYPGAPDEVAYLREPHRHIFGVCVEVEVFDGDRELEFVMVKHMVDEWIGGLTTTDGNCCNCGAMSCEHMAMMIWSHIKRKVKRAGERYWKVTVDEDGENGASLIRERMTDVSKSTCCVEQMSNEETPWTMATMAEYQNYAYQNIQEHYNQKEEMMHWAIGLGEESGEVLSVVKHRYYAGCYKDDDDMLEDLVNELGDVLWHVSALCTAIGIGLEDVAKYNVAKLSNRYPNGKFEKERSETRHEVYQQWKNDTSHDNVMEQIRKKVKEK